MHARSSTLLRSTSVADRIDIQALREAATMPGNEVMFASRSVILALCAAVEALDAAVTEESAYMAENGWLAKAEAALQPFKKD